MQTAEWLLQYYAFRRSGQSPAVLGRIEPAISGASRLIGCAPFRADVGADR
jgi:hypothetical protein